MEDRYGEILIYQTEDGLTKINVKMQDEQFGLRSNNWQNCINPVSLMLVNILNISSKRENWTKSQLFGNFEQLLLMAKIIM